MEAFILYLVKSSVWLTGFALIYLMILRNERFFVWNRAFLITGILASIFLPFFTWHFTVIQPAIPDRIMVSEPQLLSDSGTASVAYANNIGSFSMQQLLLFIYLLAILFLILRTIRQTGPVIRLIRNSKIVQYDTVKLIRTDKYPASFSFFSFVFVNPSISDTELIEIMNHEREHIRQQHWIDLLLYEITRTTQWFNPVIWLYGRMIRQNHEYLADKHALQHTANPAIYRAALLNQLFECPVISLANSFNYSLNKKRFNMMKKITYSPIRKLKFLSVIPLIAGVLYAFAAPEYQLAQTQTNTSTDIQNVTLENKTVKGKIVTEQGNILKGASIIVSGTTMGTISDTDGNFKIQMDSNTPIIISYVGYGSKKVNPDFEKDMVIQIKTETIGIEMMEVNSRTTKKAKEPNRDKTTSLSSVKKDKNEIPKETTKEYCIVEQMPEFPGGFNALKTFIENTLKYPIVALENKIIGKVFVKFVVSKDGGISDAKISKGVDPSLDQEALRVVNLMPKWTPGKQNGETVDVTYEMPIKFNLPPNLKSK